ncbi:MAG: FtsB/FtsL family cell division protein [Solirubrobacteraceae bacterium]
MPRRVSGPAGGRLLSAAIALPLPGFSLKPGTAPRRRPAKRHTSHAPFAVRAIAFVRALPDHSLLDRIVRGRAWIPLLGLMLAGIVAMQVEVLKLGASIGRSITRTSALQSRNQQLRAAVAELSSDQRIERLAAQQGMLVPAPGAVGFLAGGPAEAGQAIAGIRQPDPQAFLSQLAATDATIAARAGTGVTTSLPITPASLPGPSATGSVSPSPTSASTPSVVSVPTGAISGSTSSSVGASSSKPAGASSGSVASAPTPFTAATTSSNQTGSASPSAPIGAGGGQTTGGASLGSGH